MPRKNYHAIAGYPGAKAGYVGEVIAEILPYDGINHFFDVYGGMANILLHKAPHPVEYYNDKDDALVSLMLILSDEKESRQLFFRMLDPAESYDKSRFDYAKFVRNNMIDPDSEFMKEYLQTYKGLDSVQKAVEVWRSLLMSYNGEMRAFSGNTRGNEAEILERQLLNKLDIPERLKNVNILNMDALELIEKIKYHTDVLMVCDSPYTLKERNAKHIYKYDSKDEDQQKYMETIYDSLAKVLICGYDNQIYNDALINSNGPYKWYRYEIAKVAKSMAIKPVGEAQTKVTEVIWTNWRIV